MAHRVTMELVALHWVHVAFYNNVNIWRQFIINLVKFDIRTIEKENIHNISQSDFS